MLFNKKTNLIIYIISFTCDTNNVDAIDDMFSVKKNQIRKKLNSKKIEIKNILLFSMLFLNLYHLSYVFFNYIYSCVFIINLIIELIVVQKNKNFKNFCDFYDKKNDLSY